MNEEPPREYLGGGRYAVERELGSGGSGSVLLAYDTTLGRWVALKRVAFDEAVLNEAAMMASFQHPNIVTIHDVIQEGGEVLFVMEFVSGHTLEDLQEPLTEETFRALATQCLEGLAAAHAQGVLHRDIKPANIMLAPLPDGEFRAKILDFGQSRTLEAPSLQTIDQNGAVMGSIHTMAPEQLNREALDMRTDLYSLGCVFYQALTLRPPFEGGSVAEVVAAHLQHRFQPLETLRPDIPPALAQWVEGLFALDREDRPASAEQALRMLETTRGDSKIRVVSSPGKKSEPVHVARLAPVFKPIPVIEAPTAPVAVLAAAKPATSPHRIRHAVPVHPVEAGPGPSRKGLWIAAAAAAIVLLAVGAFLAYSALSPKGELVYGADLSNGICPPGTWTVENGIMKGNGKSEVFWSRKEYENFELNFDVRVGPGANSGIFLRCPDLRELRKKRRIYRQSALEVEIIEGPGTAGSILTVAESAKPVKLQSGKWHSYKIKAIGPIITVAVDGETLCEVDLSKGTKAAFNPDGTRNILTMALKDLPRKGRIGIQDWLGPVEFRNFRIQEL